VDAETAHALSEPGPPRPAGAGGADGAGHWAVTALFREHHLELVRLAVLITGDLATAEDVVQDAFERLHRGWHRLREPGSGLAYARTSVVNGCRMAHRRSGRLTPPDGTCLSAARKSPACGGSRTTFRAGSCRMARSR
jgi:DNA-directed RNA polymerase specialized sigma24 family protein